MEQQKNELDKLCSETEPASPRQAVIPNSPRAHCLKIGVLMAQRIDELKLCK